MLCLREGVNTRQHLKRHEITHTKSFKCTEPGCGESFYKHQSLRHHWLSVHEKSLTCQKCNKTFSRPYRLAQHNLKYHSETPVYQCDTHGCFANFKTWSALQFHIKTEHPKLICPECGKGCVGKKGLKSHIMMNHDNDKMVKLWNCTYCDVGQFTKKLDLIQHYNALHDGNIPDDLLKVSEREQLEKLLQEKEGDNVGNFVLVPSDDEDEEDDEEGYEVGVIGDSKSIESLNSTLKSGRSSIIDMILTNYQKRTIPCPKKNCDRKFAREYDLQRHLTWHASHMAKIESFLESLEGDGNKKREIVDLADSDSKRRKLGENELEEDLEDDDDYNAGADDEEDDDFNNLIDEEIKRISSQGQEVN